MGRNNGDFYHGSSYPFKKGDIITPQGEHTHAFATDQKWYARGFGDVYAVEPVESDGVEHYDTVVDAKMLRANKGFRVKRRIY
jgi:hypothetical protein